MEESKSESHVQVITVSELVRRNRPVTATSSLLSSSSSSSSPSSSSLHCYNTPRPPDREASVALEDFANPNPNPKVLVPLNYPAILSGVLTLPTYGDSSVSSLSFVCSRGNCFVFSDGLCAVCCDIVDFDVRVVGKKVIVSSWNFIPFQHEGRYLEITKWRLSNSGCSSVDSFPFKHVDISMADSSKVDAKACHRVHGVVESVSPVVVVPCTTPSGNSQNGGVSSKLRGYLVEIMACECKLCKVKTSVKGWRGSAISENIASHSFNKRKVIYFCGFASSWHPVMTKLVGTVVLLSGLKKKLVFLGKDGSELMYLITDKSLLHMPGLLSRHLPSEKTPINGRGECATYTGTVKGIYMQGMVVELDKDVWLLLTDQVLTPLHSLRVGALISVKNVHFINPKFSWSKALILGSCSKTSITVEIFSQLQSGAHLVLSSQSLLMKYIDSLAFSARLWVFLVVSCFRKKFAGFLSEQEIHGSKHIYARSKLPSSAVQSQQGLFMSFCRHGLSGCCSTLDNVHPQLVLPISSFMGHAKISCTKTKSPFGQDLKTMCNTNQVRMLSTENRRIILLGSLKISPSSGNLQIVDASGGIDVLIPDLPSFWDADSIYEVNNYELVVRGIPEQTVHSELIITESLSCRHIFQNFSTEKQANIFTYALFHLQTSTSHNKVIYPCIIPKDDFEKPLSGTFQLLRVTHKFPLLQKFEGDPAGKSMPSTFAEAIFLPWVLLLNGKDTDTHQNKGRRYDWDNPPCKRHKIDNVSSDRMILERCGNVHDCCSGNALLKLPCSATITIHRSDCMVSSGRLCYTKDERVALKSKTNVEKVLLEFKPESYVKYQLLHIGGYYITDCSKENLRKPKVVKFVVSLGTYLWSLSFSPNEVSSFIDPLDNSLMFEPSINTSDGYPEDPKLLPNRETFKDEHFQDVNGRGSANVILEIDLKVVTEGLKNISMTEKEADGASQYVDTMTVTCNQASEATESSCGLPVGNLISLKGHVISLNNSDYTSLDDQVSHENQIYLRHLRYTQARRSIFCIYLSMDHHILRIFGGPSKHMYPVGFGPDVDATFYRILQLGQNDFMLTPVSYIVINSVRVINSRPPHKNSDLVTPPDFCKTPLPYTVPSGIMSDMIQCSYCKPMSFCSRVVAIHVLVLEKKCKNHVDPRQTSNSKLSVSIPLAGFILDDGSAVCCCWASDESAATFLRLSEEITPKSFGINHFALAGNGSNKTRRTSIRYVEKAVEKHERITVKNHGSILDSSCQDLLFSVSSDDVLCSSDGNLLRSVIFNACVGTVLSCQGKVMDSNAIQAIKKYLTEMEMPLLSMPNIWIETVCHRNTLADARNLIDELLTR